MCCFRIELLNQAGVLSWVYDNQDETNIGNSFAIINVLFVVHIILKKCRNWSDIAKVRSWAFIVRSTLETKKVGYEDSHSKAD